MSRDVQREIRFLGATSAPPKATLGIVLGPMADFCLTAERSLRTLKENLLWVRWSDTIEELRQALPEFQHTYNKQWLIERHGHRPPAAIRKDQIMNSQQAA